ncbi:MAG: glycosyltransferase 87 family protein [Thermoleophilaceae bacterium]
MSTDTAPELPPTALPVARATRAWRLPREPVAVAGAVLGALALLGLLVGCALVAVAAEQHHTFLSPSVRRSPPAWLVWPFHGLWTNFPEDRHWIQNALDVVLLGMLACYLVALGCVRFVRPALVWGAVVAVYVVLFLAPPLLLTDVFNYIDYARMGVLHHLNPYTHIPLANKHDVVSYHLSNWHHLRSPYGPLFTLLTYALVPLGVAGSYWTYKALVMLAGIGVLVLVARLARRLGVSPTWAVVLVGLNPIVLLYGQGGQHNDVFTVLLTLASLELLLVGRERFGGAAIVGAAALKATAGAYVPIVVAGARSRWRALVGAATGALALGGLTYAFFGAHLPAVGDQSKLVTPLSMPNVFGYVIGRGGEGPSIRRAAEMTFVVAAVGAFAWSWRRRDAIAGIGWLTVAILVTLGWNMPWYLGWLLPFVALVRGRWFRVVAVFVIVWMTVQWLPTTPHVLDSAGFAPHRTHAWKVNKAYLTAHLK